MSGSDPDLDPETPKTPGMGCVWAGWIGFWILGPILFLIGSASLRQAGNFVLPSAIGLFFGGLVSWFLADSIGDRNAWSLTKKRVMTVVFTILGLTILPGVVFVACGMTMG